MNMGYCYEVRLLDGDREVASWDISGSYRCIDGDTHPFNVMEHSLCGGLILPTVTKENKIVFVKLRDEVQCALDHVRDVQDSRQWEQSENILREMLVHLDTNPDLRMQWVDTDAEYHP